MKLNTWYRIICITGLLAYLAAYLVLWLQERQLKAAGTGSSWHLTIHFSTTDILLLALALLAPAAYFIWAIWAARRKSILGRAALITGVLLLVVAATSLYIQCSVTLEDYNNARRNSFDLFNPTGFLQRKANRAALPLARLLCIILAVAMAFVSLTLLLVKRRRQTAVQ